MSLFHLVWTIVMPSMLVSVSPLSPGNTFPPYWLPFTGFQGILGLILRFWYKSLNGLVPSYLSNLIQPHVPSRSLGSSDHMLLAVPRARLKHRGDCAFAVAAHKLWNTLLLSVSLSPTLSAFKSNLNTFLCFGV